VSCWVIGVLFGGRSSGERRAIEESVREEEERRVGGLK
jgi:hypothetical protein